MLKHFVEKSRTFVGYTIRDSTGQSIHVDDYLGESESRERINRRRSLNRIYNAMNISDKNKSKDKWRELIENN